MKISTALVFAIVAHAFTAFAGDTIPMKSNSATKPMADDSMVKRNAPSSKTKPVAPTPSAEAEATPGALPKPFVAGMDTYGSKRINEIVLKDLLGNDLDKWVQMGLSGDPAALDMEMKLTKKIKEKFGFAVVEWSIVEYFEGETRPLYITLDVVEAAEVAARMPFLPQPTGEFKDPDGLIKAWNEYQDIAIELVETGEIEPEADECVAFHCPFGHSAPRLKRFEKPFVDGVKKNAKALIEIQTSDKRGDWRAAATYLLAYLKDGKKVISLMVDRIKDSDVEVRNNALRVLGDIAEFHTELIIPVQPVLEALRFPRVSDRSKALYVAYLTALSSQDARNQILKKWVPELLTILECKQVDHKELSQGILRKISGKEYASNDITSWKSWYAKLPGDRTLTRK